MFDSRAGRLWQGVKKPIKRESCTQELHDHEDIIVYSDAYQGYGHMSPHVVHLFGVLLPCHTNQLIAFDHVCM